MSQWGSSDASSNAVLWAPTSVKLAPNTDNRDAMYGNTTADAFITGEKVGMFGAGATELAVGAGGIASIVITNKGSGYSANAVVTVTGGGGSSGAANAEANATGYISIVNIENAGSSYENNPTIAIAAPAAKTFNANTALIKDNTFNANTGVNSSTERITTSSAHGLSDGDKVQYLVAAGNTAIGGLTNAASYYITNSNTTVFTLSATAGGANVNITATATSETGHTLRRVGQGYITIASNVLQGNDAVTYAAATGNTAIAELTSGTVYYVKTANATTVSLSATKGGDAIVLTPGLGETGHSLTGETATAKAVVGGAQNKGIAHTGWVLRREGTGGRAGRVQYEVLVAGGISSDGSDDTILPDA